MEKPRIFLRQINLFLKTLGTNVLYRFNARASKSIQETLKSTKGEIIIFGAKFQSHEIADSLLGLLDSLAWFTYRKNFEEISNSNGESFITDANWGCTIRVAQMFLFRQIYLQQEMSHSEMRFIRAELLLEFLDTEESQFSIHKFCALAEERKNARIGQFWKPNIAFFNMNELASNAKPGEFQSSVQSLCFLLSSDGMFSLEEIVDRVYQGKSVCLCKQLQPLTTYNSKPILSQFCRHCDFRKTLII